MTEDKATSEHWEYVEQWAPQGDWAGWTCLLEIRARIEALEARERNTLTLPASSNSLVWRVQEAIDSEDKEPIGAEMMGARAAILEVVMWLRERGGWTQCTTAAILEKECEFLR